MKKLSVLIALALVLTIGGAYATWTYATASIGDVSGTITGIAMTGKGEAGAMGTLAVTSTPSYQVDPIDGTYNPKLIVHEDGSNDLVITFAPSANASDEIKEGIAAKITIEATGFGTFDGETVLTVKTEVITIESDSWDDNLTYTITAEDFIKYLTLAEVNVDTSAKYDTYNSAISAGTITITVSTDVVADVSTTN